MTLLRQTMLFHGMDATTLHWIAGHMTEQSYGQGDLVFREGDTGDRLYILLTGTMHVYVEREGKPIIYATLQAGECFGEMALLEEVPRSATVRATVPSLCLTLAKEDFLELIQRHPPMALGVMKSLCQRLHHANAMLQQYPSQA
jgi:CRP-like cAMP-binding protein